MGDQALGPRLAVDAEAFLSLRHDMEELSAAFAAFLDDFAAAHVVPVLRKARDGGQDPRPIQRDIAGLFRRAAALLDLLEPGPTVDRS